MPDYDEYGMGYKDRSAIFNSEALRIYQSGATSAKAKNPVFNRMIIIDGIIEGTWRRLLKKDKAVVETYPFANLSGQKQKKLNNAIERFEAFATKSL